MTDSISNDHQDDPVELHPMTHEEFMVKIKYEEARMLLDRARIRWRRWANNLSLAGKVERKRRIKRQHMEALEELRRYNHD